MSMTRWFGAWCVIEGARGNDESLAISRSVRHWTVAAGTDLPGEAFRLWQIKPLDQFFAQYPAKLIRNHGDIRRPYSARRFSTARTIAMSKSHKWRFHLIADRFAKATSSQRLFRHNHLPDAKVNGTNGVYFDSCRLASRALSRQCCD
jgi:hypothetical protein